MNGLTGQKMKEVVLSVIEELSQRGWSSLQFEGILGEAAKRLHIERDIKQEEALLTFCYDLFRQGQLSWGKNLMNPNAPFCHLTDRGRETLRNISRDPANPDGYMAHLLSRTTLNPISESYIREALQTYNANLFKATAVMVGCAAESISLELRDKIVSKLKSLPQDVPENLQDWRIRTVLQAIQDVLEPQKSKMPRDLREAYGSYWPAFTQQIRTVRNEAGHPLSVDPVTADTVHSSLLIFPELALLSANLKDWVGSSLS